jgi:uncharacterized protein (DUF433 family)
MLDWTTCQAVERDPAKVSGAWLFRGTRVPVHALFENLADGATVEQLLSWFPGVARSQVDAVLAHPGCSIEAYNAHIEKDGVFSDGLRSF